MKHITVKQVLAAYNKTGLRPQTRLYVQRIQNTTCGCPLVALLVAKTGHAALYYRNRDVTTEAENELGLTQGYIDGFITGTDDGDPMHVRTGQRQGFKDGKVVVGMLFERGLIGANGTPVPLKR